MENLADLERKYEELGKEIERLKEQQNGGRVRGERFYYIEYSGDICSETDDFYAIDDEMFKLGNCFKTKEEAEKVIEKIKIYNELKRLAERLNNGKKIDWNNDLQIKYCIEYYHTSGSLRCDTGYSYQKHGTIYCLDFRFKDIAIQEIGEDRLKKLFE